MAVLAAAGSLTIASPLAGQTGSEPTELTILLSPGFAAAYDLLAPQFEQTHGVRLVRRSGNSTGDGPAGIPGMVARGEPADVVIVAVEGIAEMVRNGGIDPATRVDLGQTAVGMAVPDGRPRPDISTPDRLRQVLLDAERVAYSPGPSGIHISTVVLPALGIVDQVTAKAVITTTVPEALLRGEAEIGFQQVSELVPVESIDFVAPLPEQLQQKTSYAAAVVSRSTNRELASALISFLASDEATPVAERMGLERPE
jgi:molybdate transport system substrate-binding protein